jgi:hypothetical protein
MQSIIIIIRCYKLATEKTEPNRAEQNRKKNRAKLEKNQAKPEPNQKNQVKPEKYFSISVIDIVIFIL